jgi:hypothetical protein
VDKWLLGLSTLLVAACAGSSKEGEATLEIDGAWARTFQVDQETAYRTILAVLAEEGWALEKTNPLAGSISAKGPVRSVGVPGLGNVLHYRLARFDIENAVPGFTRIRLMLTDTREPGGRGRQPNNDRPVRDRSAYEEVFQRIEARFEA